MLTGRPGPERKVKLSIPSPVTATNRVPPPSSLPGSPTLPPEVGVCYLDPDSGQLRFIGPELASWKPCGFWKKVGTIGLTKGHLNGIVDNASSRYLSTGIGEIYIHCMEGTSDTTAESVGERQPKILPGSDGRNRPFQEWYRSDLVYVEPGRIGPFPCIPSARPLSRRVRAAAAFFERCGQLTWPWQDLGLHRKAAGSRRRERGFSRK